MPSDDQPFEVGDLNAGQEWGPSAPFFYDPAPYVNMVVVFRDGTIDGEIATVIRLMSTIIQDAPGDDG